MGSVTTADRLYARSVRGFLRAASGPGALAWREVLIDNDPRNLAHVGGRYVFANALARAIGVLRMINRRADGIPAGLGEYTDWPELNFPLVLAPDPRSAARRAWDMAAIALVETSGPREAAAYIVEARTHISEMGYAEGDAEIVRAAGVAVARDGARASSGKK
jgi:hypothetical protein